MSENELRESSQTPPIKLFSPERTMNDDQDKIKTGPIESEPEPDKIPEKLDTQEAVADKIDSDVEEISNENAEKESIVNDQPELESDTALNNKGDVEANPETNFDPSVVNVSSFLNVRKFFLF